MHPRRRAAAGSDPMKSLAQAGRAWNRAKDRERELASELYEAMRAAHAQGIPETQIAEMAGVNRMTVRRALNKL